MSLNVIQKWFRSDQDFDQGLLLLKTHAPGHRFFLIKDCFRKTAYNEGKLKQAMREIEYKVDIEEQPKQDLRGLLSREERLRLATMPETPVEQAKKNLYPEEVSEAMQKRRKAGNMRDKLANQLGTISDQIERAQARAKIEELHAEIQGYNDIIGTWDREQRVIKPTPPPPEPEFSEVEKKVIERENHLDSIPVFQQLTNARSNRSKKLAMLKKWRKREDVEPQKRAYKIEKYKTEAEEWDKEVKRLEIIVNEQKEKQEG